jgi:hypothetical protein
MKCVVPTLIGLVRDDPSLAAFMREIANPPQRDEFGGLEIEHFPQDGLSLYFDEQQRLTSVFLFSGRTADGARYRGALPEGVSFEFGRGDTLLKFGHPERSGPDWDRFLRDGRIIHFQYADGGASTAMITVFAWDRNQNA